MSDAVYLYCFASARLLPPLEGPGIGDEQPLAGFIHREVAAVVSRVSAGEFCGPEAEAGLCDPVWLVPRVCRHQEVISRLMGFSPVMPARFGTIFHSLENLEVRMKTHYVSIMSFLDRMIGKEEWGVKVLLDRGKAREELFNEMVSQESQKLPSSPGARYFKEQRIKGEADKRLHGRLMVTCDKVAHELDAIVEETFARRVPVGRVAEGNREMLCNWAVLIRQEDLPKLQAFISMTNEECLSRGLAFELSGPWPPYSFCPLLEEESSG